MYKLDTIQKRENLNEVYSLGPEGPGGANHDYVICQKDKGPLLLTVEFQKGPRNDPESRPGVLDCDLLEIVRDRLKGFQSGPMATMENEEALHFIERALKLMNKRVEDRINRGVLGTMEK